MTKYKYAFKCPICNQSFQAQRRDAKYCSHRCRNAARNQRNFERFGYCRPDHYKID
jgi:predicted nucleic acid-binding Zn ribbon protein